jgi:hypothetical protein
MGKQLIEEYVDRIEFSIPDHGEELQKASLVVEETRFVIDKGKINKNNREYYYRRVVKTLEYIGKLSDSIFNIEDELEVMYIFKYKNFPELGRKIFSDHYSSLHKPYNVLKKKCWKMLDEIEGLINC